MCHFTLKTHYPCTHTHLLTTPRHTFLCPLALNFNLRQGIDRAPASCHPLPDDARNPGLLVVVNHVGYACGECRGGDEDEDEERQQGKGEFDGVVDEEEEENLEELSERIERLARWALRVVGRYEKRGEEFDEVLTSRSSLPGWGFLERVLVQEDSGSSAAAAQGYNYLFIHDIRSCGRFWIPTLRRYLQEGVPRKVWIPAFEHVERVALAAGKKVGKVQEIIEGLERGEVGVVSLLGEQLRELVEGEEEEEEFQTPMEVAQEVVLERQEVVVGRRRAEPSRRKYKQRVPGRLNRFGLRLGGEQQGSCEQIASLEAGVEKMDLGDGETTGNNSGEYPLSDESSPTSEKDMEVAKPTSARDFLAL